MFKREITYVDYNGEKVTDTVYFNMSKPELIKMQVSEKSGMQTMIQRVIEEKDNEKLMELFQDIILQSYGKKSEDGKRFIKSQELRDEFAQTAAYEALFMELATQAKSAAEFLKGIMPSDMGEEIDKAMKIVPMSSPNT